MVRLPRNKKQTYRLNSTPQMWPSDLTLAVTPYQGQIGNLLYLGQKWSDYHETKSKHIDWTLCLKCDHRIWPWLWIFKVKFGIPFISTKDGLIASKWKVRTDIEWTEGLNSHQVWPWLWPWKVRCKDLPDSDRGDFRFRRAVDSFSFISYLIMGIITYSCWD